jgi:hypothetical protein
MSLRLNGSVLGKRNVPTADLATGAWNLRAQLLYRRDNIWPRRPIFETAGYTRLWAVTTQSSGDITGSAETDTGYYAVKWWDDTVDIYDSGDPFSKAAIGNLQAFEVYPCDIAGVPEGQFDGFDLSDNSLTQVRSEGVTLVSSGGALTGGYYNYYWGYWWWGPYFSPIVAENGIISDNLLSAEALDQFYTDLDNGTGFLFVSGNLGIDTDDPTIATAKGYTVIGSVPPSTALLLNFNGSNGSTTFTDSSPNGLTVTANGDAEISTTESKFGGSSGYFDGVGDSLEVTQAGQLVIGLEDYTVEFFVFPVSLTGVRVFFDLRSSSVQSNPAIYTNGSDLHLFLAGANVLSGSLQVGQWQHVAVSRRQGESRLFVDGVQAGGVFSDVVEYGADSVARIGNSHDNFPHNAYIDDLRVVKGFALYTANFTPPTSQLGVYP